MRKFDRPRSQDIKFLRAIELRKKATWAETLAWRILRNRGCLGLKFRRQQVLYGFIVDFYCAELRLAIEIDGSIHDDSERRNQDKFRDLALVHRRIRVVRIKNQEISRQRLVEVIQEFRSAFPLSARRRGGQGVRTSS